MNKEHLLKIINNTWLKYCPANEENADFKSLFEPDYKTLPFGEQHTPYCLRFDPKKYGMTYKYGQLSCTGLELNYKHERFDVSVNVFYDYSTKEIYNSVLAIPKYTQADWNGKKNIRQSAVTVLSDKDLKNYLIKLRKRFECPVLV